ncbi:MAG: EAL domain-containing protein [Chloroflexi bacterium]|nr:EAL domain-containing protein [Chloroflexota bacterium]
MRRVSLLMLAAATSVAVTAITVWLVVAIVQDINTGRRKGDELQTEVRELEQLRAFQSALFIEVGALPAYLVVPEPRYVRDYEVARARAAAALEQLRALEPKTGEEAVSLDQLIESYGVLTASARAGMEILQGNPQEADLSSASIGGFVEEFDRVQAAEAALSAENERQVVELNDELRAAVRERSQVLLVLVVFWSSVIVASAVAAYWLVLRPIIRLSHVARSFAGGHHAARVPMSGPRELAQLATDMNHMFATTAEHARSLENEIRERGRVAAALERTLESERELRNQLHHQAFHDPLTGLSNRARFMDRLDHALARRTPQAAGPSVLFMDLDDFKSINDTLGHAAGDELLRHVGDRLQQCLRPADTLARLGGDEFGALIEDAREDDALIVAERIMETLRAPFTISDREIFSRVSVGAVHANGEVTAADLMRHADVAMYVAKNQGKARVVAYRDEMEAALLDELALEGDMQRALERREFVVQYQPIVGVTDEGLNGFEALVRWHHPTRGVMEPEAFIHIAERIGLMTPIGEWVLREACRSLGRWQHRYPKHPPLAMSVNVSARQLSSAEFADVVSDVLAEAHIDPSSLILEITESSMMIEGTRAIGYLQTLHDLGVRLAVDDFGTGYSSLSYLRNFPLDELKVDKSFIDHVAEAGKEEHVVRSIISLAKALHLRIVAEGVERNEQLEILRAFDCDEAQGFLFSTPMDADDAERLLASGERGSRMAA